MNLPATNATARSNRPDSEGAGAPERAHIIDGPDAVVTSRDCDLFRWRVRHAAGEQSVYVEIAWSLVPEELEEPLRGAVESKGREPLLQLLAEDARPLRIKLTSAGIFIVDIDGYEEPV